MTVDTNGKTKHGIQFYCAEGGKLKGVTVNGGTFTSVMVNGAKATLTDCTLNPADGAYANIEYGMGTGVTTQPEMRRSRWSMRIKPQRTSSRLKVQRMRATQTLPRKSTRS